MLLVVSKLGYVCLKKKCGPNSYMFLFLVGLMENSLLNNIKNY